MKLRNLGPRSWRRTMGLGAILGASVFSLACGDSQARKINASGSWFWIQTDTSVQPPVSTQFHVTLNQSGNVIAGTKLVAGQSCAISGTLHGKQMQGEIGAPCNETFSVVFVPASKFPPYDFLSGWVTGSGNVSVRVFAPRDKT